MLIFSGFIQFVFVHSLFRLLSCLSEGNLLFSPWFSDSPYGDRSMCWILFTLTKMPEFTFWSQLPPLKNDKFSCFLCFPEVIAAGKKNP